VVIAWHGLGFARLRLTGAPLRAGRAGAVLAHVQWCSAFFPSSRAPGWTCRGRCRTVRAELVTVFVAVLFPLLMAAQALVWWTFRERVNEPGYL
jgi:cytochrome bd-type quinol oxidase subunit 2